MIFITVKSLTILLRFRINKCVLIDFRNTSLRSINIVQGYIYMDYVSLILYYGRGFRDMYMACFKLIVFPIQL